MPLELPLLDFRVMSSSYRVEDCSQLHFSTPKAFAKNGIINSKNNILCYHVQ